MSRRWLADVTPLRTSSTFRALFGATFIANIGQGMTAVAVGLQVYRVTGSSFAVGLIGFIQFLPLVAFSLLGGNWSDRHDRRSMALMASTGLLVCSLTLGITTATGVAGIAVLYLVVAAQSAAFGVGAPARQSMLPRILPAAQLPAANSLNGIAWNFGATIGPMLGGFIVGATNNTAVVYFIDAIAFAFVLSQQARVPKLPPTSDVHRNHLHAMREGFEYLRGRRHIKMNLYIDIVAMVFGMPRALFPAIATTWYAGDQAAAAMAVGVLSAAVTAGALISSIFSGPLTRVHRHGAAVVLSVFAWGATIALFGMTPNLWLGSLMLMLAGASDNISAIFRNTIMQASVPDELRGRMQGIFTVVVAGGPRLGDLESGTMAAIGGEPFSVITGGIFCLVGAGLLTWRYKDYWAYDARERAT